MTKNGEEADTLFKLAAQKYQEALVINPNDDRALFLWGNMLSEQSRIKKDKATVHSLLVLACRKYQQSYAINPRNFDLLYNWGNVLLYRAKFEEDNPDLLSQASDKYSMALALKPSSYNALKNWGVALSKSARLSTSSSKAASLFSLAESKFKDCLLVPSLPCRCMLQKNNIHSLSCSYVVMQVKPSDHEVYFNWGNTLYRYARMKEKAKDYQASYDVRSQILTPLFLSCSIFLLFLSALRISPSTDSFWRLPQRSMCKPWSIARVTRMPSTTGARSSTAKLALPGSYLLCLLLPHRSTFLLPRITISCSSAIWQNDVRYFSLPLSTSVVYIVWRVQKLIYSHHSVVPHSWCAGQTETSHCISPIP